MKLGWICCLTKRGTAMGTDYKVEAIRVKKQARKDGGGSGDY